MPRSNANGGSASVGLLRLPPEVAALMIEFLPPRDALKAVCPVSRHFMALVRHSEGLWVGTLATRFRTAHRRALELLAAERTARGGFIPHGEGVDFVALLGEAMNGRYARYFSDGYDPQRGQLDTRTPPPQEVDANVAPWHQRLAAFFRRRISSSTKPSHPGAINPALANTPNPQRRTPQICVRGPGACGKTAFVARLVRNEYNPAHEDSPEPTTGVEFSKMIVEDKNLYLWDTSGNERFEAICNMYLRPSRCLVFIVDGTFHDHHPAVLCTCASAAEDDYVKRACLKNSLQALENLLTLPSVSATLPLLVVVTKMDCATSPLLSTTEIMQRVMGILSTVDKGVSRRWAVCGTSSKDGKGFDGLADWIRLVSFEDMRL